MDPLERDACDLTEEVLLAALRRLAAADLAFVMALCQDVNRLPERETVRRLCLALLKCWDAVRSDPSAEGTELIRRLEAALAFLDRKRLLVEVDELTRKK